MFARPKHTTGFEVLSTRSAQDIGLRRALILELTRASQDAIFEKELKKCDSKESKCDYIIRKTIIKMFIILNEHSMSRRS